METDALLRRLDRMTDDELAAQIKETVASWPEGAVCAFCGEMPPAKALVMFSPAAGAVIVAPCCAVCAVAPPAPYKPLTKLEN